MSHPPFAKACFLFELCEALAKEGCATPALAAALKRYNVLTGGSLNKRFGERWKTSISAAWEFAGTCVFLSEQLSRALGEIAGCLPSGDPGVEALKLQILEASNEVGAILGSAGDGMQWTEIAAASGFSVFVKVVMDGVAAAADEISERMGRVRLDYAPLFDLTDASSLECLLESALSLDFALKQDRIPCIAIGGLEGLMKRGGRDGRIPWLEKIVRNCGAFFILSGRREMRNLPEGAYRRIRLDAIDEKGLRSLLGPKVRFSSYDRELLELASESPGLIAMYAEGLRGRLWKAEERALILAGDDKRKVRRGFKRLIPGKCSKASLEDVERAVARRYAEALQNDDGRQEWQLIAQLSWVPEWSTHRAVGVLSAASAASEYIGDIKDYAFIQEIDAVEGLYRVHPSIAPYFREISKADTWYAMLGPFEALLSEDFAVKDRAIETLVRLWMSLAYECLATIQGETPARLVRDGGDDGVRDLFELADCVLDPFEHTGREGKRAETRLHEHLLKIVELMSMRVDDRRWIDPEGALKSAVFGEEISSKLRFSILPKMEGVLADENRCTKTILAHADAQRKAGAVYSDHYRNTSDITNHLHALRLEVEALRAVAKTVKGDRQSVVEGEHAAVFAGCVSSVATSCFRLKRYDIALRLISLAESMEPVSGNAVGDKLARMISNNYGAIRYSFVEDCCSNGSAYPAMDWDDSDSKSALVLSPFGRCLSRVMLNDAISFYAEGIRKERAAGPRRSWDRLGNYAECLRRSGRIEEAFGVANELYGSLELRGQQKSNNMARCLAVRSRIQLDIARSLISSGESGVDEYLRGSFEDAGNSRRLKIELKGESHLDVAKADLLIEDIKRTAQSAECRLDEEAVRSGEDFNLLATVNDERAKGNRKALEAAFALHSSREIVGRIVRGDAVSLWEIFGLEKEEFEKRFAGEIGLAKGHELKMRVLTKGDVRAVSELARRCGSVSGVFGGDLISFDFESVWVGPSSHFGFVAEIGDSVAACCVLGDATHPCSGFFRSSDGGTQIEFLVVDERYDGYGLQEMLVDHVEFAVREKGIKKLAVVVDLANTEALKGYLNSGYGVAAAEKNDISEGGLGQVTLVKRL